MLVHSNLSNSIDTWRRPSLWMRAQYNKRQIESRKVNAAAVVVSSCRTRSSTTDYWTHINSTKISHRLDAIWTHLVIPMCVHTSTDGNDCANRKLFGFPRFILFAATLAKCNAQHCVQSANERVTQSENQKDRWHDMTERGGEERGGGWWITLAEQKTRASCKLNCSISSNWCWETRELRWLQHLNLNCLIDVEWLVLVLLVVLLYTIRIENNDDRRTPNDIHR